VLAPVDGIVLFAGELERGGTVVLLLGPRWRLHYLAHLESRTVGTGRPVAAGATVGTVGDSGNARGKPPHLHYAIVTLLPYPWRITGQTQGWKKAFFLDPGAWLASAAR
jgi:murein DD-endopeptidase MepM/ murein hydrolase activator NlpD